MYNLSYFPLPKLVLVCTKWPKLGEQERKKAMQGADGKEREGGVTNKFVASTFGI